MKIYIEYEIPTASGNSLNGVFAYTIAEAEEYCKIIETNGCKIRMVNIIR